WFKQIDWNRTGQALEMGIAFGGALGLGGFAIGRGFNKWASNRRRKQDEAALSVKDVNISDEI
ncbi:MAG TPA: hypothetical protein DCS66_13510, partial [Flavobacteriaceae bacterium]|nr:hypothetical protein [Flavobacteriaceae bacterium]